MKDRGKGMNMKFLQNNHKCLNFLKYAANKHKSFKCAHYKIQRAWTVAMKPCKIEEQEKNLNLLE